MRRREKGWKHNGNTARNADTRIRRRFVEATKKKKKKNEAGYGVKREEKVETRKGGGGRNGVDLEEERERSCVFALFTRGKRKKKRERTGFETCSRK